MFRAFSTVRMGRRLGPSGRLRLALLLGGILFTGFMVATALIFETSRQSVRESVLQNELPLLGDSIYSEIQADLMMPVFIASLMANDTFVQDWLSEGEQDTGRITRYLRTIRDRYGLSTAFLISDATRNYYHFTGPGAPGHRPRGRRLVFPRPGDGGLLRNQR